MTSPDDAPARALRVLIADDEPLIRKALRRMFEKRGHAVWVAEDAPSANELIDAQPFDAALVDLRMPGNGVTVIRRLEDDPNFRGLILLMTGDLSAEANEQVGPHVKRLQKPFRFPEVVPMVEESLRD